MYICESVTFRCFVLMHIMSFTLTLKSRCSHYEDTNVSTHLHVCNGGVTSCQCDIKTPEHYHDVVIV